MNPLRLLCRLPMIALPLFALGTPPSHATHAPAPVLGGARQLVLVLADDWNSPQARLARYERDDASQPWRAVGDDVAVTIGRNGAGWGQGLHPPLRDGPRKHEGDGRAPAGVFALGTAFGYGAEAPAGAMPYRAMQATHWCIDVPASPLYNRIVDRDDVGARAIEGATEPMRRDLHLDGDQRYALGLVIEHNPTRIPGAGSCIFAHLWQTPGEATAGCTAMDERTMRGLLQWLDPARTPRFVLLPRAIHARVAADWRLPPP